MFQELFHVRVWFVGVDDSVGIGIASVHAEKSGVGADLMCRWGYSASHRAR